MIRMDGRCFLLFREYGITDWNWLSYLLSFFRTAAIYHVEIIQSSKTIPGDVTSRASKKPAANLHSKHTQMRLSKLRDFHDTVINKFFPRLVTITIAR